jgi:regulatory protein
MTDQDKFIDAYNKSLDYLSYREHSELELSNKLIKKGFESSLAHEVIDRLVAKNLVNNARFADVYVNARKRKGFGPKKIFFELKQRGIQENISDKALFNDSNDWQTLATNVFSKKFTNGVSSDLKEKSKQQNFMIGRGFRFQEIESIFN